MQRSPLSELKTYCRSHHAIRGFSIIVVVDVAVCHHMSIFPIFIRDETGPEQVEELKFFHFHYCSRVRSVCICEEWREWRQIIVEFSAAAAFFPHRKTLLCSKWVSTEHFQDIYQCTHSRAPNTKQKIAEEHHQQQWRTGHVECADSEERIDDENAFKMHRSFHCLATHFLSFLYSALGGAAAAIRRLFFSFSCLSPMLNGVRFLWNIFQHFLSVALLHQQRSTANAEAVWGASTAFAFCTRIHIRHVSFFSPLPDLPLWWEKLWNENSRVFSSIVDTSILLPCGLYRLILSILSRPPSSSRRICMFAVRVRWDCTTAVALRFPLACIETRKKLI